MQLTPEQRRMLQETHDRLTLAVMELNYTVLATEQSGTPVRLDLVETTLLGTPYTKVIISEPQRPDDEPGGAFTSGEVPE